jgi:hypothetical protein
MEGSGYDLFLRYLPSVSLEGPRKITGKNEGLSSGQLVPEIPTKTYEI